MLMSVNCVLEDDIKQVKHQSTLKKEEEESRKPIPKYIILHLIANFAA